MKISKLKVGAFLGLVFLALVGCSASGESEGGSAGERSAVGGASGAAGENATGGDSVADAGGPAGVLGSGGVATGGHGSGACLGDGGKIITLACTCPGVEDFPDTCTFGVCACSPGESHDIQACQCPAGTCFGAGTCLAAP